MSDRILGVVLAGGAGSRLQPLTATMAKPAVPFGGSYRLIDFVLSNMVNSGINRIVVLTQFKGHTLARHLARTWARGSSATVVTVPAYVPRGSAQLLGTVGAIVQAQPLIAEEEVDVVVVAGGDHVYRMDYRDLVARHLDIGCSLTVATTAVAATETERFGMFAFTTTGTVSGFAEKPTSSELETLAAAETRVQASMGIYAMSPESLASATSQVAVDYGASGDMGRHVVPHMLSTASIAAFDFDSSPSATRQGTYWRDVGTIDGYFAAHQDLLGEDPDFQLRDPAWGFRGWDPNLGPVTFSGSRAAIRNSLIGQGCVVDGASVVGSVLSHGVGIGPDTAINRSVIHDGVIIGRRAQVNDCILGANVEVPDGTDVATWDPPPGYLTQRSSSGIMVICRAEPAPLGSP